MMKAIKAYIHDNRYLGNCSNDGISARYGYVYIEHPQGWCELDDAELPENTCKVVTRYLGGREYKHVEPIAKPNGVGWMFGGSVVYSSDSRFAELSEYPLCLHDRCESQELYNMLSR